MQLVEKVRMALESKRAATEEGASAVLRDVAAEWERLIGKQSEEHLRDYQISLRLR